MLGSYIVFSSLAALSCAESVHRPRAAVWQWDIRTTIDPQNGSVPVVVDEIFEFTTNAGGEITFRSVSKSTAPAPVDSTTVRTASIPVPVVKTVTATPATGARASLPLIGTSTRSPSISTGPPAKSESSSSSPAPSPSSSATSFQQEVLNLHNKLRALHSARALTWDPTLASYAQNFLKACEAKHTGGPYGENLAWGYPTATEAIQAWYDEYKVYSYADPIYSELTGHYTQMVWKHAAKMGCGMVLCDGTGNILICEYDIGNIIGDFAAEVLPQLT